MPMYEYRCTSCGHDFELRQSFSADTVTDCPKCGKLSNRRISPVPIIFKGSGWYVTDYAGRSGSSTDSTPGKRTKEEDAKAETATASASTETSKPAPKAETSKSNASKTEAPKSETKAPTASKTSD